MCLVETVISRDSDNLYTCDLNKHNEVIDRLNELARERKRRTKMPSFRYETGVWMNMILIIMRN